jgi:dTDP-4-amino-4,6-dideoxygalactose transaminase
MSTHSTSTSSLAMPALLGGTPACEAAWLRSGQWWYGQRVRELEEQFAAFQGARFGVTCTNGTTAIEMALRAVGVVEGDEVIVPPYSFIATASAVVTVGAIPVFADICSDTLCLDAADVARKITTRTRAIVSVHVGGRMADMPAINALAQQHQLLVLEDSAHAWGSKRQDRGAGTWSLGGTFSFQVTKNITAGEGGMLVTDDESVADLCRSFTHCGRTKNSAWYDHDLLGSNLRMTEFQAAVLLAQLERLPEQIVQREQSARLLDQGLDDLPGIQLLAPAPEMTRRSYHMYMFRLESEAFGLTRAELLQALKVENVPASEGWYRPLYRNGVFQNAHQGPAHGIKAPLANKNVDYRDVNCPVCEQVCRDTVWIPQHVLLGSRDQVEGVVHAIRKIARHAELIRQRLAAQS